MKYKVTHLFLTNDDENIFSNATKKFEDLQLEFDLRIEEYINKIENTGYKLVSFSSDAYTMRFVWEKL